MSDASTYKNVQDLRPGDLLACPGHHVVSVLLTETQATVTTEVGETVYELAQHPAVEVEGA